VWRRRASEVRRHRRQAGCQARAAAGRAPVNAERANGEPGCGGYTAAMTGASPRSSFLVRAEDCRRMRWKNGAGWTSEILRVPDVEDWRWRLSIAEVETDAPFSPFPGVERELVLLGGNGMR